jgi:RNA methyltransferase, TrmH family
MLPKSLSKTIRSLKIKKYRSALGLYVIEGRKIISEALAEKQEIMRIVGTEDLLANLRLQHSNALINQVTEGEINRLSTLKSNSEGLAILKMSEGKIEDFQIDSWTFFLDEINDPGNLGTIIRTADWFGFKKIICSLSSCDHLNPKAIMASMGSVFRVSILYASLKEVLFQNPGMKSYGADMDGESLEDFKWPGNKGLLVFGNEANGISQENRELLDGTLKIRGGVHTESLNVAQSAAIFLNDLFVKTKAT